MSKPTLSYHTPHPPDPSGIRSAILFAPAVPFIAVYLLEGFVPREWNTAIACLLTILLLIGEVIMATLLIRWWHRLHDPAKGGAVVLLTLGASLASCVFSENLGLLWI